MKATFASVTQTDRRNEEANRIMTPEEWIAYQARISSPQRQHLHESSEGLLRYCLFNAHWSPFDMVDLTMEIETSRGIMAQILRHHSFRFQEFSQRYADPQAAGLGQEPLLIRRKHEKGNRQGSAELDLDLTASARLYIEGSAEFYADLIKHGAAPESARFVLPLNTTTRGMMKGSVRSWITYFWQRLDGHAQQEHRDVAWEDFDIFKTYFPLLGGIVQGGKPAYIDFQRMAAAIKALESDAPDTERFEALNYLESLLWEPAR